MACVLANREFQLRDSFSWRSRFGGMEAWTLVASKHLRRRTGG